MNAEEVLTTQDIHNLRNSTLKIQLMLDMFDSNSFDEGFDLEDAKKELLMSYQSLTETLKKSKLI